MIARLDSGCNVWGALPCDWAGDPLSFANVNSKEELELLEKEAK